MTTIGMKAPHGLALLATGAILALAACSPGPSGPAQSSSPAAAATTSATSSATASTSAEPTGKPTASATVGAVVDGFPSALLPLMPGATVVSSSFDKSSTPANAALVATIAGPPAAVVEFYTGAIEAQGFKAVPGDSAGSIASKDFVRGTNETINLSVVEVAGASTFTLGANVAPESIK
ncbi:hypothetical protein V1638_09325 [Pseudarthrobacter sp. J64]|uniref:hypothetical protein n=1 Tax=Pseudarthrobacter sp. J64 TaxID=3116485 RepID=UPI002E81BB0A|nr:hypothetical protein [Pseudarthrobacter sp. J64]MEE2569596.1 hypothetical protein [Pseudarthrobacter sp. J64]